MDSVLQLANLKPVTSKPLLTHLCYKPPFSYSKLPLIPPYIRPMKAPKFPMLVKVLPYLNNRYFLTGLGFLIWISFFDRNDFITTWTYSKKLKTVQKEKLHYEEGIKLHKAQLQDLHSSKENLEKYAREQYNLKKENEDVFLIVEK